MDNSDNPLITMRLHRLLALALQARSTHTSFPHSAYLIHQLNNNKSFVKKKIKYLHPTNQ